MSVPSQMQRFLCDQCLKAKGLKGEEHRRTKETDLHGVPDICSPCVLWPVADWEAKFCLFSNMVPKSSRPRSC